MRMAWTKGLTAVAATFDELEAASLKLELTPQGLKGVWVMGRGRRRTCLCCFGDNICPNGSDFLFLLAAAQAPCARWSQNSANQQGHLPTDAAHTSFLIYTLKERTDAIKEYKASLVPSTSHWCRHWRHCLSAFSLKKFFSDRSKLARIWWEVDELERCESSKETLSSSKTGRRFKMHKTFFWTFLSPTEAGKNNRFHVKWSWTSEFFVLPVQAAAPNSLVTWLRL